jgi:glycosyltransferase involved in cell wall biosynthesis
MDIGILTPSASRQAGGLLDSVRRLAIELHSSGNRIVVYSLSDRDSSRDLPLWTPVPVDTFHASGPNSFGYSKKLRDVLLESKHDVLLTNGLWQYFSSLANGWSRKHQKPYIANPHGMLDPWALRNSKWKKRIAALLYEKRHLRQASCIRALCVSEVESIRAYGLNNPVCVIPNGIPLPTLSNVTVAPWSEVEGFAGANILLSLGRLHPKKNLIELLRAWNQLQRTGGAAIAEWRLVIAGWDDGNHAVEINAYVQESQLQRTVWLAGPLFGSQKDAAYQSASAFIIPSLSEGLPMAVLEAWSYALPVIMTPACNLPEGFAAGAAIATNAMSDGIATAVNQLINFSKRERESIGQRGRALCIDKFCWPRIAGEMLGLLRWVLGEGEQPPCVLV